MQPLGNNPTIYMRRGEISQTRHYVLLPNSNTYVRRLVSRGLSAFDAMYLTQGQNLRAVWTAHAIRPRGCVRDGREAARQRGRPAVGGRADPLPHPRLGRQEALHLDGRVQIAGLRPKQRASSACTAWWWWTWRW
ncbi:MAG: hypothetical protein R3F43_12225 [bacterium]